MEKMAFIIPIICLSAVAITNIYLGYHYVYKPDKADKKALDNLIKARKSLKEFNDSQRFAGGALAPIIRAGLPLGK